MPGTQRIQPLLFFKAFTMPITAKTKARMRLSDSDKPKITLYPPNANANAFIRFMTNESRRKISEIMPLRFCLFFRMFIVCPPCVSPIVSHFARSLQGGRECDLLKVIVALLRPAKPQFFRVYVFRAVNVFPFISRHFLISFCLHLCRTSSY